jgi:branched-chain amino acid aminotransferase
MASPRFTWMDGQLLPWAESRLHVNTDCVLRGINVFEGVRAYRSPTGNELLLFRLADHLDRLFGTSMRVLRMTIPYTAAHLTAAVTDLLQANDVPEDTHIRIVVYFGEGPEGTFRPEDIFTGCFILALPRPQHARLREGIRCSVSAWRRISDNSTPARVKAGANYLNSRYATTDARLKGFDLPILLNERGQVAEGPGQCLFLVRDGVLITPQVTESILEGITRDTVLALARARDIPTQERAVDASELYVADEVFFAGTAAEVQPISAVDHYLVADGRMGPVTGQLQAEYLAIARGERPSPNGWVTRVAFDARP